MYITSEEIKQLPKNKKIYIFGTGIDADNLMQDIGNEVNITAYIDNRRYGVLFHKHKVISGDELNSHYDELCIVIIASYRFAHEIYEGLNHSIWIAGKNCFIWDEDRIFSMDDNTQRFIEFNKKVWSKHKRTNVDNIILVPYDNVHSASPIVYSYFANYLAEQFDAKIWGISSRGGDIENESKIIKNIFNSFNVERFLSIRNSSKQQRRIDSLLEEIWQDISTWEDWAKIKIFGIEEGTSIIRYINRFFVFDFDPRTENNKRLLRECLEIIVAIEEIFEQNNIKALILRDAVCWENFIRESAVSRNIPTYVLQHESYYRRVGHDFCTEPYVVNYRSYWEQLTDKEKKYGIEYAKENIEKRMGGSVEDIPYMVGKTVYDVKKNDRQLHKTDNIKVLIYPHIFEEDEYVCGPQIFDNNYISWMEHLGKLSEITPKYDWYIKMHPSSEYRDEIIVNRLINRYPRIKLIETMTSPIQLKEEGVEYVLTIYGTVAHEYAYLGIPVINAGVNMHCSFDFSITPKTKEEYDEILLNLDSFKFEINKEQIFQFYAIQYLYYDQRYEDISKRILKNPLLYSLPEVLKGKGLRRGTWMYELYMKEWNVKEYEDIYREMRNIVQSIDDWNPQIFYKRYSEMA